MEPTAALQLELRTNTEERIPPGGTAADTMFSDDEVEDFLELSGSIQEATWRAWRTKALRYLAPGTLVSATVGSESLKFQDPKDLAKLAAEQAEYWFGLIPVGATTPGANLGTGLALVVEGPDLPGITTHPVTRVPYPTAAAYSDDISRLWTA